MKKLLSFIIISSFMFSLTAGSFAKDLVIRYVDIFKVFNDYEKTKDYDKNLEKKKGEAEDRLSKKKEDLEAMQNKLSLLKDEEKKKEQEKITKEIQDYRNLEQEVFTDIKKERDEKMKEIVDDIDKIISSYAEKNGFTLVLDANSVRYGDKEMDITAEILKIANQNYKKK